MIYRRSRFRTVLGLLAILAAVPAAQAAPGDGDPPAQAEVIAAIQARLSELGYYRGQTDGIVGQMTREAIRRYERQIGVEPTGQPSLDIYRRLRESTEQEPPTTAATGAPETAAAAAGGTPGPAIAQDGAATAGTGSAVSPERSDAAPAGQAAEAVTVSGASWRFRDEYGAVFTVRLRPDGTVGGVTFSDSWSWKQDGDSVELRYANGLGRTATRRGTLVTADAMAGSAQSSAGADWTWTAERLP